MYKLSNDLAERVDSLGGDSALDGIVRCYFDVAEREAAADFVSHRLAELDSALEGGMRTIERQEAALAAAREAYIERESRLAAYRAAVVGVPAATAEVAARLKMNG